MGEQKYRCIYKEYHSQTLRDIIKFLNENNIKKEDILSIQKTNDMYILIFCEYGRG